MIHSYPSIYAIGHKAIEQLFSGPVLIEEKIDGCVTLDTPILKSDLTWVPAGDLSVGDELVGLKFYNDRLHLEKSVVTAAAPIIRPCVRVATSKTDVVATRDHPFWVRRVTSNNPSRWCNAESLKPGMCIPYLPVWDIEKTWESGYLAGQYDGEGSLVKFGKHQRALSYYQRISPSQEYVKKLLLDRGYKLREDVRQRNDGWKQVWSCVIGGGWGEILRFLGSIRPQRLLEKSEICWIGGTVNGLPKAEVLSISDAGDRVVMGLSTTTETYWAGGLASHNSQFSMCRTADGELLCRSKGQQLIVSAPEKMFKKAVDVADSLDLRPDWVYRCEYLEKPKHNTLAYGRVPVQHLIVFDVCPALESYLSYDEMAAEANRLGLEFVPRLHDGMVDSLEMFKGFLERESILGGCKIEGVVVKNYALFTPEKKVAMGKFVSESFKEKNSQDWKERNPSGKDFVQTLIERYRTDARWQKAVQHIRESGKLEGSPRDIGLLIREVPDDILKEYGDEIKDALFVHFWQQIKRGVTAGLPEWYKELLAASAFESNVQPK